MEPWNTKVQQDRLQNVGPVKDNNAICEMGETCRLRVSGPTPLLHLRHLVPLCVACGVSGVCVCVCDWTVYVWTICVN